MFLNVKKSFKLGMAAGLLASSCLCLSTEASAMHRSGRGHGHGHGHGHDGAGPARGGARAAASEAPRGLTGQYQALVNALPEAGETRTRGDVVKAFRSFVDVEDILFVGGPSSGAPREVLAIASNDSKAILRYLGDEKRKHFTGRSEYANTGLRFSQAASFLQTIARQLAYLEGLKRYADEGKGIGALVEECAAKHGLRARQKHLFELALHKFVERGGASKRIDKLHKDALGLLKGIVERFAASKRLAGREALAGEEVAPLENFSMFEDRELLPAMLDLVGMDADSRHAFFGQHLPSM